MTPSARLRLIAISLASVAAAALLIAALSGHEVPAGPPAEATHYVPAPAEIAILLSGNEKGLMAPCGCSTPQRGGLPRRAALWDLVRSVSKASAAVSLGETLFNFMPDEDQMKAELFRAALSDMDYQGMLLGPTDLSEFWSSLWMPYGTPAQTPRPPLNVRVKRDGFAAACASTDPVLRFEVGGLKVRAVSLVDPVARGDLVASNVTDTVQAPETALLALPKEPGLLIVAAHVYRESLALVVKAAQAVSDMAVVVDMRKEAAYDRPVKDFDFSKPLFVMFDDKGKAVGILRLAKSAKPPGFTASYEAVFLDPEFEEGKSETREKVRNLFEAHKKRVRDEKLLEKFSRFPDVGPTFVGSEACTKCHAAIYESWQATPHAFAFNTLVDNGVERDPECAHCHTVGWVKAQDEKWSRSMSSFFTPEESKHLLGVGCESCHGAGSDHVKWPDKKDLFDEGRAAGKMWKDFGRVGCAKCHDIENSVHFVDPGAYEKEFRPVVDHHLVPKDQRTVVPK